MPMIIHVPRYDWIEDLPKVRAAREKLEALSADLPDLVTSKNDERVLEVWGEQLRRYETTWAEALMAKLKEAKVKAQPASAIVDDDDALVKPGLEYHQVAHILDAPSAQIGAARLGELLQDFTRYVELEVEPLVKALYAGLDALQGLDIPGHKVYTTDPDQKFRRDQNYRTRWLQVRVDIKNRVPHGWVLARIIDRAYHSAPPEVQAEAKKLYGDFLDDQGRPWPIWHTHWPTERIIEADEQAAKLGIRTLQHPDSDGTLRPQGRAADVRSRKEALPTGGGNG